MENYKKILIIQTAFLGDAILSTPFLRELKNVFPDSEIDVLCIPQTKAIFETNPNVNRLILFDKRQFYKKIFSIMDVVLKIRKQKYDMGFSIQSSLTSSAFMLLGGIKNRLGFTRQKFLTKGVPHTKGVHKIKKILRLLEPFTDYEKCNMQTEIFYTKLEKERVDNLLKIKKNKKYIGIAPGSIWPTKRWLKSYFKKLVKMLDEKGFGICLIGGGEDYKLCEYIKNSGNALNFAGKLNVRESAALIEKMDLMLTNDSAPLHIANAVKTDVFAFFGPTVKRLGFYPYRKMDKILQVDLDCRPCGRHGGNICPIGTHACMTMIKPEFVIEEILKRMGND